MIIRLAIGVGIGVCIGALMGHFGKCSTGGCPLTANPYRGAIYGGVMGALFAFSFAGRSQYPKSDAGAEIAAESSNVVHVNNATDFKKYVTDAKLPCLADFYSDNCRPCRMLAPKLEKLADEYIDKAVICKVSLDAEPGLAQPYGIRGIPAVLFFENGQEIKRVVGLKMQGKYAKILDEIIAEKISITEEQ